MRRICACGRPHVACICDYLPGSTVTTPNTSIIILQHHHEAKRTSISSVPLISHCLTDVSITNSIDTAMDSAVAVANCSSGELLLLYPCKDSISLDSISKSSTKTLLLVDGTWAEAKGLLRQITPLLPNSIIKVHLPKQTAPSLYGNLRREPHPHCVSTLEALAHALDTLGENTARDVLLKAFNGLVTVQSKFNQSRVQLPECNYRISVAQAVEQLNLVDSVQLVPLHDVEDFAELGFVLLLSSTGHDGDRRYEIYDQVLVKAPYDILITLSSCINSVRKRGNRVSVFPLRKAFNLLNLH